MPENEPKLSKIHRGAKRDGPAPFKYSKASTACRDNYSRRHTRKPLTSEESLIKISSGSKAKANMEGDRGHP